MQPNELSELFNLSERRKYDIFKSGAGKALCDEAAIIKYSQRGAIVIVSDDYDNFDKFPTIDVAVLCGYKVENLNRKFIVRKLTDLSVSVTVTDAAPLVNSFEPVVLNTATGMTPFTCHVLGYRFAENLLTVRVVGSDDNRIDSFPLEHFQTIKKDS